jgi:ribosome biogenesis protein Tsr3
VDALRDYLTLSPREARQKPSWLAGTLWAYDRVTSKPTREAVEAALAAIECENRAIEKQSKGA